MTPPGPRRTVVIVGAGASGTLAAAQLLHAAEGPLSVVLIERAGCVGLGAAYGTRDDGHLLNVPAGRMSALPDQPDHFLRWLDDPSATPFDFVPRRRYGLYLGEFLDGSEGDAAPGVTLRRVRDDVAAVEPHGAGARVVFRGGERIEAGRVVLALGNPPAADPPVPGLQSLDDPRYVRDPWAPGALERLPERGPILLLGSGLTMVDVVVTLTQRGHVGPFIAVSRRGLLPRPHLVPPQHPAPAAAVAPSPLRPLVRAVRAAIAAGAGESGAGWRAVVDGLRPVTQALWRGLSDDDKRRFLRHVRPYWDTARHRMAPEIAARVEALRRSGVLVSCAARVLDVAIGDEGLRATVRPRGGKRADVLELAAIVNCTGPGEAVASADDPLVSGLLREGHARRGPLGFGLDTADDGALVGLEGQHSNVLFTLGPLRKGNLWETTAIPEIRVQARSLATTILAAYNPSRVSIVSAKISSKTLFVSGRRVVSAGGV